MSTNRSVRPLAARRLCRSASGNSMYDFARLRFFLGISSPANARFFDRVMLSISRLRNRKSDFAACEWMLDSGAFGDIASTGHFRLSVDEYARAILRWSCCGTLVAAVAQDIPCLDIVLMRTSLSVWDAQHESVTRYDVLRSKVPTSIHIMPVLQGRTPNDYLRHLDVYGTRLTLGMWVGVGALKRLSIPQLESVVLAVARSRPDLKLHGFGVGKAALRSGLVHQLLHSADSMAWSYKARLHGHENEPREFGCRYVRDIETRPVQLSLWATGITPPSP